MSRSNLTQKSSLIPDSDTDLTSLNAKLRTLNETLATGSESLYASVRYKWLERERKIVPIDGVNSIPDAPQSPFARTFSDSASNASLLSAVAELEIAYPGLFDWTDLTDKNTVSETPIPSPELLAAAAEVNAIFPDLNDWIPPSFDCTATELDEPQGCSISCTDNIQVPSSYPHPDTKTVTDIARTALSHLPLVDNLLKQRTNTQEQKIANCNKAINIIMDETLPYDNPFQAAMGLVFLKELGLWQYES